MLQEFDSRLRPGAWHGHIHGIVSLNPNLSINYNNLHINERDHHNDIQTGHVNDSFEPNNSYYLAQRSRQS
jgi:hypothetical protein